MTDDTTQAPSADDLSDEAKKSLNPKLKKLAEIRSRAEAVIERTEEEELELIEDALEADFGDKATTVTGELPDPASYDSGESTDAPSDEPVTLEPSEATTSDAAPGGDGDANAEDSGAPAADVAADQDASGTESGAESDDVAGAAAAPSGSDAGATDPAPSGESASAAADAPIVSHPGTPQQYAGVVNDTDNSQPSAVTERDALAPEDVPDGEVPVNNGNPASPVSVPVEDLVGEGTDLTADNAPLPPDAVQVDDTAAEQENAVNDTDPSVEAVTNTEAQTTSDAAPAPATPAAPNTPNREG